MLCPTWLVQYDQSNKYLKILKRAYSLLLVAKHCLHWPIRGIFSNFKKQVYGKIRQFTGNRSTVLATIDFPRARDPYLPQIWTRFA